MQTSIYYFSATGNSLQVARDIAKGLQGAKVVRITDNMQDDIVFEADCIGIVFPVYAYGPPVIVKRFIGRISMRNSGKYVFIVGTCRSRAGGALVAAANMLRKRKLHVNAGFVVYMPGNYIHLFSADTAEEQKAKFDAWDKQKSEVLDIVQRSQDNDYRKLSIKKRVIDSGILYPLAAKVFRIWDSTFRVDENCNGCGVCERVCPVTNIVMTDGKPTWQHRCEQCLACINLCPKSVIQCSKATQKRIRYIHPNVRISELMRD